jgi:hypothetical protein
MIDRATRIILHPRREWPAIGAESTTAGALYTGYIAPLAALGPIAGVIGAALFGVRGPLGATVRAPLRSALGRAVLSYLSALIVVYLVAVIIDVLAPTFSGRSSRIQALKTAAYSFTAIWLAGIFAISPRLVGLRLIGLYALYLLYTGLPVTMRSPAGKAFGYTALVAVATLILLIAMGVILGWFFTAGELAHRTVVM